MMKRLAGILLLLSSLPAQEEKKPAPKGKMIAIRGGKVYSGAAAPFENGVVLLEGGKIVAAGVDVKIPDGCEVFDATGKVIVPGLIDAASRAFLGSPEDSGPGSPDQDAADLLDPFDEDSKEIVEHGITTVCIEAAGTGAIAGTDVVVKPGADRAHWILARHSALRLSLAGTGDTSSGSQRFESVRGLKSLFDGAKQYLETWEKYRKDLAEYEPKKKQWDEQQKKKAEKKEGEAPALKEEPKKPQKPRRDPRNEVLAKTLDPKAPLPVRVAVHHADTIAWVLELAQEFKLKLILDQCTEGARLSAEIAKAKVPVVVGPVFRYGLRRVDHREHSLDCAAALAKAGVTIAIASFPDEGAGPTRFLMDAAAFASSKGFSREQALRTITLEPARILGIDKSVGSLEKGKAADLVVLSGEPFEADTKVERTMTDGVWVFLRKID